MKVAGSTTADRRQPKREPHAVKGEMPAPTRGDHMLLEAPETRGDGFLPPIASKTSMSSESDMDCGSFSNESPSTRRSSRGSSLTSSPTKLPSIDRCSSNSMSSNNSLHTGRPLRSPSCPNIWGLVEDGSSIRDEADLLRRTSDGIPLKLPDINISRDLKNAAYLANVRETYLEKQLSPRKRGALSTLSDTHPRNQDTTHTPRRSLPNPVLLPVDKCANKENEGKKTKRKRIKHVRVNPDTDATHPGKPSVESDGLLSSRTTECGKAATEGDGAIDNKIEENPSQTQSDNTQKVKKDSRLSKEQKTNSNFAV